MATVTVTAPANVANLSKPDGHFRDASFSYLAESVYQISLGSRRYTPDGEISIFDAEKYFKGGEGGAVLLDDDDDDDDDDAAATMKLPADGKNDIPGFARKIIRSGTPSSTSTTTCSEASWNSQSALLRGFRRENVQKQQIMSGKRTFFSGFGCNCSGKKSVDIGEKDVDRSSGCRKIVDLGAPHSADILTKESFKIGRISAAPPIRLREDHETGYDVTRLDRSVVAATKTREDRFSFTGVLMSTNPEPPISRRINVVVDEEPRMSIEVFGSPFPGKNMDPSEHRRLMMLPYSGQRVIPEKPTAGGGGEVDDDLCSDSSSDLFELGGLPGPQPALSRQGSDGGFSCAAPTEASIEWSVVTASAADYSVAGSECGELRPPVGAAAAAVAKAGRVSMVKEAQRRQSGSLLGCKSSKAVNVAAEALRPAAVVDKSTPAPRRRLQSGNGAHIALYGSPQYPAPSVSRCHSPRALGAVRLN